VLALCSRILKETSVISSRILKEIACISFRVAKGRPVASVFWLVANVFLR
jgi:hypothetical protein